MAKIAAMLTVSLSTTAVCAHKAADAMFGVRWGMTAKQVSSHHRVTCHSRDSCIAYESVGGLRTAISFEFFRGRLAALNLQPDIPDRLLKGTPAENEEMRKTFETAWSKNISELLNSRYGDATTTPPSERTGIDERFPYARHWRKPDTDITFIPATEDDPANAILLYEQISTRKARWDASATEKERRKREEANRF